MGVMDLLSKGAVYSRKARARKQIVTGIVLTGLGIFLAIFLKSFVVLILSVLGVIAVLNGWSNLKKL